jgi:hypothetical protein
MEVASSLSKAYRKDGGGKSAVIYQDLVINQSIEQLRQGIAIDSLIIQNYYVHKLMMQQLADDSTYQHILDQPKVLMPSAEVITGGEASFTIKVTDFNKNFIPGKPIRFILIQPSLIWLKYELVSVKVYVKDHSSRSGTISSSARDVSTKPGTIFDLIKQDIDFLKSIPISATKLFEDASFMSRVDDFSLPSIDMSTKKRDKKTKSVRNKVNLLVDDNIS